MKDQTRQEKDSPGKEPEDPKKILVLSGDSAMYEKVKKLLARKPYYNILQMSSFDEAYPCIKQGTVDFVLYDVNLALEEGMKKLDMLKAANDKIPVVVSAVLEKPEREKH
ncbi:MAG: response regulator [Firmicutes bacterium]|nr:response regulator [Bacillota bacterium]